MDGNQQIGTAIEAWVMSWLAGRAKGGALSPSANYFEVGIIDSFGAIEFVEDIETRFGIRFSDQDFQDERFYSARGVAAIIAAKTPT
jgi:D-alanine--poly(phosphoribitol) ligase subunit 2